MGDILHALPAVAALRQRIPNSYIGWAVEPRWKALLAAPGASVRGAPMPIVDRLHPVPTREWKQKPFSVTTLRQIASLKREMQAEEYDICVDLQGSIRSAIIGRMSGAKRFIGARQPRERQARALYGERVEVKALHVIQQACELAGAAIAETLQPAPVSLPVDPEAERWCEDQPLAQPGFVLLTPGAGWGAKQWPRARFAELARALSAQGLRVLVNSGAAQEGIDPIVTDGHAAALPCSVAQLIALTRRAALVIGGDTGPVHLAAALGRPVVALFGPTDPHRNGPAFPGASPAILRHHSSLLSHRRLPETEAGLARITVEEVLAAARTALAKHKDGDG